jgi:hydroxymethylpyrimidine kinase/phosphomethylpyrimidine kinase
MSLLRGPVLVSVAGFDPSAGAGVLLDLGVFRALGFRGAAVLSALTVQDSERVRAVRPLPAAYVLSQFRTLARDVPVVGVKVGMLGSGSNLGAAARILAAASGLPRVVDPVLRASSGAWLLERSAVPNFLPAVRGRLSLLTPNLSEASALSGLRIRSVEDMERAARRLAERALAPCLVKGGHLPGRPVNVLFDGRRIVRFVSPRIDRPTRGTGCFFSSAVLALLARGLSVEAACRRATRLAGEAIRTSAAVGRGRRQIEPRAGRAGSGPRTR